MRSLMLGAAVVLLGGAAMAQPPDSKTEEDTWIIVRFLDGAMAWNLHAGKWNQAGDTVEGQRLIYYGKPQMIEGEAVTWKQDFWKITCPANTIEITSGEELSADLESLFDISSDEPSAIQPNTPDYFLKLVYCDNNLIEGAFEAKGIIGAMEAMSKPAP